MGALDYLGSVTPSTRTIAAEVVAHLDQIGKPLPVYPDMGSQVIWGKGASSEHATGRALDFMVQGPGNGVGDAIADYVWANRDRLGLIHIIWRQRIKSTKVQPGVWRKMSDRGSPTENHMDHPHCFFDGRAVKAKGKGSSSSKPKPATPRPKTGRTAPAFPLPPGSYFGPKNGPNSSVSGYYSHRSDLKKWQARMAARGWRITADGLYGPATAKVARSFQAEKGLAVDGLIGPATWAAAWTAPIT